MKTKSILAALLLTGMSVSAQNSEHQYVDLGLSVYWATCNIGATSQEDYGDYFAWGEVSPKNNYMWDTYQWGDGTIFSHITKYDNTDGKNVLDPSDDAAHVKWGGDWRMPTAEEVDELLNQCTVTISSVGCIVTGKNGNSIILPASGEKSGISVYNAGKFGYYWASEVYPQFNQYSDAHCISLSTTTGLAHVFHQRREGVSIRPVCPKTQAIEQTTTTPEVQKTLINGQVVIIRGNRIYNLHGQEVK